MPSQKVIHDIDPATGLPTSTEGIGGTIGRDVAEGWGAGTTSPTSEPSASTRGAQVFGGLGGVSRNQRSEAGSSQPGYFRLVDPFLQHMVPRYTKMVENHFHALQAILKPYEDQKRVAQGVRAKFADQTGFWAGLENFLSDPLALLGLAGMVASAGAGSALATKEALSSWTKEQGAEEAVKKLDKLIASIDAKEQRIAAMAGHYRQFTPLGLGLNTDSPPGKIPKGVVLHHAKLGKEGILGTGPLPHDFQTWFKRSRKPLGPLLTPHLGKV